LKSQLKVENFLATVALAHSGVVYVLVIVCDDGTEDRGFESRQDVSFLVLAMLVFAT
jgi:hypothetical protein